ncbi:biotin--protein ligase-like [Mercenaria mercenaria]|uniref:biotin--protein ligase-like n=1 Tax=Mercenaria mercenaria TaxID=6596 RepID=UPI00234EC0B0|nr:biotin--protein ligase-like [Mercenaria mercenaria]
MLLSVGYLMLYVARWWSHRARKNMYLQAVRQVVRGSSIFIRRSVSGKTYAAAGSLIQSSLVNGSPSFTPKPLVEDDHMEMLSIEPKQIVNLKDDWTAYYRPQGEYVEDETHEDIMLLLEARRPTNVDTFLKHELEVAPAEKVHILAHGAAVAWKSGTPFGIILHCTLDEFVTLAMAFCEDRLTMDEDLEVNSIMTVKVEGKSTSLVQNQEIDTDTVTESALKPNSIPAETDRNVNNAEDDNSIAKQLEHLLVPSSEQDQLTELWSNESLASNSSIGRTSELLDMIDSEARETETRAEESMMESGAGEGLSDFELAGSSSSTSGSLSQSWRFVRQTSLAKPPNVLVYAGKIDSVRKFNKVKKILEQCLDNESYVIYHLKHEEIETTPWIENTILLVIASKKRYADSNEAFLKYFKAGGKILGLGSGFDQELVGQTMIRKENWIVNLNYKSWSDVSLISGMYAYDTNTVVVDDSRVTKLATDKNENVLIVKVNQETKRSAGSAILSQVLFDKDAGDMGVTPEMFNALKKSNTARFEILGQLLTTLGLECSASSPPVLTPAVLVAKESNLKHNFLKSIENRLSSGVLKYGTQSLQFTTDDSSPAEENLLPVLTEESEPFMKNFNQGEYCGNLKSRILGNTVIYVDVIPTTMTLLDGLMFSVPETTGLIAIARQQTQGVGRGGNSWLSPIGCAMFSLHVKLPVDSNLGKAVSYLQHITSLAVVYSVCTLEGYQDIDLRLKWPNDIYYGREMKLGGVIVKSTFMDGMVHATIGCGFNVDNSNPTICINDLIQLHNRQEGTSLPACTSEQLIGRTVTCIENLIDEFQTEGAESFKQKYYEKWLHSNSKVNLQSEGNAEVQIIGLDEYGYLLVETADGVKISVQPDGNSFDMMKNLISMKTR